MEEIKREVGPHFKVEKLQYILCHSDNTKYCKFMVALKKEHKDLYNEVKQLQDSKIQLEGKWNKWY